MPDDDSNSSGQGRISLPPSVSVAERMAEVARMALGPRANLLELCRLASIPNPDRFTGSMPELPTTRELLRIADLTGCSLDWVLLGQGTPFPCSGVDEDGTLAGLLDEMVDSAEQLAVLTAKIKAQRAQLAGDCAPRGVAADTDAVPSRSAESSASASSTRSRPPKHLPTPLLQVMKEWRKTRPSGLRRQQIARVLLALAERETAPQEVSSMPVALEALPGALYQRIESRLQYLRQGGTPADRIAAKLRRAAREISPDAVSE